MELGLSTVLFRQILLLWLICICKPVLADNDRYWGEVGTNVLDPGGGSAQFKYMDENSGWTGSFLRVNQDLLFTAVNDNATGANVSPRVDIVSVMKTWGLSGKWGFGDVGIGLGYVSGEWGENCTAESGFVLAISNCDLNQVGTIGIPVQLSAAVGKYVGVGVGITVVLTKERRYGALSVLIPFGNFSK